MKSFWCGAVIPDCDMRFTADSEEVLLESIAQHAAAEHDVEALSADTLALVRKSITDTAE
ncbi:DUF1059 domain-containing protein [Gordonia otitidis]|uniref:DUF1059 domain-containing protein n=1 Tax=Gordonia otitidis (strain DSM 44809 / CCUG 52243 / JCM 12355 / NBRC 100426 / IFM 10032) TaxID=1108044 RepID=H5TJH3_GORO1|nr:DUF1059 domain-containing protein [Gordonia otitidis]UEA58152.1 DUF1059 domain-containing protein [Gordonia otitidis]GAB33631.1 hypothetical protein GOOTI_076_00110 [Gordonia otitidis NBRC 100426]